MILKCLHREFFIKILPDSIYIIAFQYFVCIFNIFCLMNFIKILKVQKP
jgi:hypothetical protein